MNLALDLVRSSAVGLALAAPACSFAALTSGYFVVKVQHAGMCISSSLRQVTKATVRATCQGNQFVGIEPQPDKPFFGTHGGAHRFAFPQRAGVLGGQVDFGHSVTELEAALGQGAMTTLRVLNLNERDERLELLERF